MPVDIFISYSNTDREKAYELACFFQAKSFSVFWDRIIPVGKCFDEEIESALREAQAVVVLWSKPAVASEWVRAEAEDAAKRKRLIPIIIEEVTLPLRFQRIQAANLKSWNLDSNTSEIIKLLQAIKILLDRPVTCYEEEITKPQIEAKGSSECTIENLTASESLVLLEPNKDQGKAALKLTLKELLVRKCLIIHREDEAPLFGIIRHTDYLQIRPEAVQRASKSRHVQTVLQLLEKNCKNGMLAMNKVASQFRNAFGVNLSLYQAKYIIPELMDYGLLEAQKLKVLGIFSRTNYRYTPQGEALRSRLLGQIAEVRMLPMSLDNDPVKAMQLAAKLGISILLVDEAYSLCQQITTTLSDKGNNIIDSDTDTTNLEIGLGLGLDFDLNVLSTLDFSLRVVDTEFDTSAAESYDSSDYGRND